VADCIVQASANIPKDSLSQQAKVNAAAAVIDLQADKVKDNRTSLISLPARVYIQIASEGQRPAARSLQARLRSENYLAPGIENVGSKAAIPKEIEVRYYRDEEKDEAVRIINLLKNFNPGLPVKSTPQKIPGNGKGTRPRHYEIWFSRT
jgi:hypothetical protein